MNKRIEEKYFISKNQLYEFINWINFNNGIEIFKPRLISSVYFDNYYLDFYKLSEEGITPRKKIRIRNYPNSDNNKYFLETKINHTHKKIKKSINIDLNIFQNYINKGLFDSQNGHCKPIVKVSYLRKYFKLFNHRLTIDTNIEYFNFNSSNKQIEENIIIELKNLDNKEALNTENLFYFKKIRFSKYCNAIRGLNISYL